VVPRDREHTPPPNLVSDSLQQVVSFSQSVHPTPHELNVIIAFVC